jgi:hypothetical protein
VNKTIEQFCCDTEQYAPERTITADCGGSNGARVRLGKIELQRFADETGSCSDLARPAAHGSHGCHRAGRSDDKAGLKIESALDTRPYEKGIKVSDAQMRGARHLD